jgi:nicotinamide-nucleotide amidase
MPRAHATAAILSIGDELTLGQGLDTNSQWLSQQLVGVGIVPVQHATVPDDLNAIRDAMLRLAAAADVVISTGGLGPTADDLTRQALAAAMNEPLAEDPAAMEQLRAWFAGRGRRMPEANRVQAQRPHSASLLQNAFGTAPGLRALLGSAGVEVFCLPGPPREVRPMFETQVRPHLRPAREVTTRAVHMFGLGESEVAERLGDLMTRTHSPLVGTTVSGGVVTVRIRHEGPGGAAAIAETENAVRDLIGPYVFGAGVDTLASVTLGLLRERSHTVAVVESCTGGLLGALLTDVPGSSAAVRGGWITYSNDFKTRLIGVPESTFAADGPGAVSRECAQAMARGGLERSGAGWCLSITGIAGPDGGTPEKPVGTVWIALASRHREIETRRFAFAGERANVRDWAARSALAMLRFALAGAGGLKMLRQAE